MPRGSVADRDHLPASTLTEDPRTTRVAECADDVLVLLPLPALPPLHRLDQLHAPRMDDELAGLDRLVVQPVDALVQRPLARSRAFLDRQELGLEGITTPH